MKKLITYIIVITFIGILPSLLQYGAFMPFDDFANQQIPFIMETKRMFASGAPWWSWNTYFGDNFIGAYSFYTITSPFVWINCLFPYEYIIESITFTLFLKLICMGVFTYLYLKKMDLDETLSQVGALMYVFSSFTISNLYYYHFLEPMMCFPLFLIAIEKYVREEKYSDVILALATFLIAFINFYFFPCSLIPGIIYYFCRTTSKDNHFSGKRFGYAVVLVLLGTCMSAFILLPTILHLAGGPRVDANTNFSITTLLNIFERIRTLFTPKLIEGRNQLILGTHWYSNAAYLPIFGCLLAILYCWKKKDWIAKLCIITVFFYITPLNGIFSMFTNPNYSRWAYTLVLFLILASMKYLAFDIKIKMSQVTIYFTICLLYMIGIYALGWRLQAPSYFKNEKYHFIINAIIVGLFLFSIFMLLAFVKWGNKKSLIKYVAIFSTIYFSLYMMRMTDVSVNNFKNSSYLLINQGINEKYVLNNKLFRMPDINSFKYRTDFITRISNRYTNITLLKNRPSIETYNSNQNNNIRKLFQSTDSTIVKIRNNYKPNINIPSFESLMSVRDIIIFNDPIRKPLQLGKMNLKEKGDGYNVYNNPNYIPLGFTYDHYIDEALIDSLLQVLPRKDIPLQLLANLSVRKEDIPVISKYLRKGRINENYDLDSVVVERRKNVCTTFKGDTHGFSANINMNRTNLVFFSVPADKGFTASVDGNEEKIYKVNLGQIGIVVPKGIHTIRCEFFPLGLNEGGICSIVALIIILTLTIRDIRKYNI